MAWPEASFPTFWPGLMSRTNAHRFSAMIEDARHSRLALRFPQGRWPGRLVELGVFEAPRSGWPRPGRGGCREAYLYGSFMASARSDASRVSTSHVVISCSSRKKRRSASGAKCRMDAESGSWK